MKRLISGIVTLSLLLCLLAGGCTSNSINEHILRSAQELTVTSPNSDTAFTLTVKDGQLHYHVSRRDTVCIGDSPLGIVTTDTVFGTVSSLDELGKPQGDIRTDKRKLYGRTAVADDPCTAVSIPVGGTAPFTFEVRVFDNGAAFRYRLPDACTIESEQTGFVLPADSKVYAGEQHKYYESSNIYYDPSRYLSVNIGMPATVKLASGGYAAILEGDLTDYPGIALSWSRPYVYTAVFENESYTFEGAVTTPWRIISIGADLNELVNNTIIYQVCDAPNGNFDWVRPGRATWSWITGRTTDRVTPALMEEYTQYAARLGFEYNILDEGWVNWSNYLKKLPALAEQGEQYEVGQILWTGVTAGESFGGGISSAEDAYRYLDLLENFRMAGGKIDFFTTEGHVETGVNLYRDILDYAAQKKLIVNFHGCNKPTGLDVTYPNELNREAILGLESIQIQNRIAQAQMFTTQPFVRNLAGHADYTPAVDDAFHMAQLVLTDAPMQAIGSHPQDILRSPALEMIKSVPTVWQETVVLPPSDITKSAVIARKGDSGSWFVGGINRMGDDTLTLELSRFLGEGTYQYELWTDGKNGLEKTVATVTKDDVLTIPFEEYTGFIVRFDRITLSQYGGEIDPDKPLTVSLHDPDVTVAYTLDGSEPTRSSAVFRDGDTLTLTDSCTLTVKILSGEDKGLVETYRFNRIQ